MGYVLYVFILLLLIKYVFSVNCNGFTECRACASGGNVLLPCVWCTKLHKCGNALEMSGSTDKTLITLPYDCPVAPNSHDLYKDHFARTKALPFIAATNAKDIKELISCLKNNIIHVHLIEKIEARCDAASNECMAYIAYSAEDNAIIIAFRSTNSASQLLVEAVDFMFHTQKDFQPVGGRVVSYFYDAFFAIWNHGLEKRIRSTIQNYPHAELWVFGHSLGGALASLASAWIVKMGLVTSEKVKFVSFGQPRTGDINYAKAFDSLVHYKYRVVHRSDSITQMPMRMSFIHHRYEVFYNNDMEINAKCVICLRAEDPNCSQGYIEHPDPQIHRNYFNVSLDNWVRDGCPVTDYYAQLSKNTRRISG